MFFPDAGKERSDQIQYVCSDMWKAYLEVIRKKTPQALHILDRFHIVAMLNKAVDEVRRSEAKRLREAGYEDVLKHSKYCFLKNESNLTDKQQLKTQRHFAIRFEKRSSLFAQTEFPVVLDIQITLLGSVVLKEMVRE
jgi:transposase